MAEGQQPVISVIVPVFERPVALRRALRSVLRQTMSDFECIVVDDASVQADLEAVVASFGDPRLRYLRRDQNGGPYAARFTAFATMRGRYALGLDSDWELYPWVLDQATRYLDETPAVDIVSALHVRHEDSRLFVRVRDAPRIALPENARLETGAGDRILAVRRCVVEEWLRKRDDYFALEGHAILTAKLSHARLFVDEPWTLYHVDGADRVSATRQVGRELDDHIRFLEEHAALIADPTKYVALDRMVKNAYWALRRAGRPEAARAAEALRQRGISPGWTLCEMAATRATRRLPFRRRQETVWM